MASYQRNEKSDSPSKRFKPDTVRDNIKSDEYGCETLLIEAFQGGYELILIQEGIGQDGFYNNIREDINNGGDFSKKLRLVKIVTRCVAADNDNIMYNLRPGKDGKVYPRQAILRMVDGSTAQTRRACLEEIANFLNKTTPSPSPQNKIGLTLLAKRQARDLQKYIVPKHFDLTPLDHLRKLGHTIVDRNIVDFIPRAYSNVNREWYSENESLASEFFDAPYPLCAQTELGYPCTH